MMLSSLHDAENCYNSSLGMTKGPVRKRKGVFWRLQL